MLYNAALLLVLVLVYDLLARRLLERSLVFRLFTGLVLGLIAVAAMAASLHLSGGVIFDTRSVVLSVGALFYGTPPGLIAGCIAAAYRISVGGQGALMGVLVIAASVGIGIAWRRWRRISLRDPSLLELYFFGLTVHFVMLLLTGVLPDPLATLRMIALPVLVVYPLASVVLGLLMIDARHRRSAETELRESQQRFLAFAEHMPGRLWIRDRDLRYLYVNPGLAADLGRSEAALVGKRPEELWDEQTAAQSIRLCEQALGGETVDIVERWPNKQSAGYFNSHVFAIPGSNGRPMLGGLMFDVTLQHTAARQLTGQAQRLRRTLEGAVLAISHIVEARDPYTAGHQRRVAELAGAIAREIGLSEQDCEGLRLAALVHDLGKISVPAEILSKPGRLNASEFTLIKGHSQTGHDILADIEFERPVAEIVLQHHERLDGSGYPNGLREKALLPEARVLAVADVFEAMVSHRPYRPGLTREEALAELRSGSGVLYDAEAVDACLRLIAGGFEFPFRIDDSASRPSAAPLANASAP